MLTTQETDTVDVIACRPFQLEWLKTESKQTSAKGPALQETRENTDAYKTAQIKSRALSPLQLSPRFSMMPSSLEARGGKC